LEGMMVARQHVGSNGGVLWPLVRVMKLLSLKHSACAPPAKCVQFFRAPRKVAPKQFGATYLGVKYVGEPNDRVDGDGWSPRTTSPKPCAHQTRLSAGQIPAVWLVRDGWFVKVSSSAIRVKVRQATAPWTAPSTTRSVVADAGRGSRASQRSQARRSPHQQRRRRMRGCPGVGATVTAMKRPTFVIPP
jgi:hypothetical protein